MFLIVSFPFQHLLTRRWYTCKHSLSSSVCVHLTSPPSSLSPPLVRICDRIWENPAYCPSTHIAQLAQLRAMIVARLMYKLLVDHSGSHNLYPMARAVCHHSCSHDLRTPVGSKANLLPLRQPSYCTCLAGQVIKAAYTNDTTPKVILYCSTE